MGYPVAAKFPSFPFRRIGLFFSLSRSSFLTYDCYIKVVKFRSRASGSSLISWSTFFWGSTWSFRTVCVRPPWSRAWSTPTSAHAAVHFGLQPSSDLVLTIWLLWSSIVVVTSYYSPIWSSFVRFVIDDCPIWSLSALLAWLSTVQIGLHSFVVVVVNNSSWYSIVCRRDHGKINLVFVPLYRCKCRYCNLVVNRLLSWSRID